MLVLDANVWVAAFDAADPFHRESVEVLAEAGQQGTRLAGPAYVVLESACALARRLGDADLARAAGAKLAEHPALHLEPLTSDLLAQAERIGIERRLRAADALYAATAAQLRCPLLSWDEELIARGGARSPREWLGEASG